MNVAQGKVNSNINKKKAIIGVDYGRSTVGLAIFIPQRTPSPLPSGSIPYRGDKALAQDLIDKITEESAGTVVLGLPLLQNGKKSSMACRVETFGRLLTSLLPPEVALCYQDERYSSEEAKERIKSSPPRQKEKAIHSLSACIILENFLYDRGRSNLK